MDNYNSKAESAQNMGASRLFAIPELQPDQIFVLDDLSA